MNIHQSDTLRRHEDLSRIVESGNPVLEDVIGARVPGADATWDLARDEREQNVLVLELRDPFGSCKELFAPAEVGNAQVLGKRLHRVWDRLVAAPRTTVDDWLSDLRNLYSQIGRWLQESAHPPSVQEFVVHLNEQRSGAYDAPALRVTRPGRQMLVRPIARWVAGADGRVDLIGTEGSFILVLVKDAGGWHWVEDRPGRLRPLTKELLMELAEACLQ